MLDKYYGLYVGDEPTYSDSSWKESVSFEKAFSLVDSYHSSSRNVIFTNSLVNFNGALSSYVIVRAESLIAAKIKLGAVYPSWEWFLFGKVSK